MKKRILLSLLLFVTSFTFAKDLYSTILKQLGDSELFYIYDTLRRLPTEEECGGKIPLRFTPESKDVFTKSTNDTLDWVRFPERENTTFEELKSYLKEGDNIFFLTDNYYMDFRWYEGKKVSYSREYSQQKKYVIDAAGRYVYRFFFGNEVFIFVIADPTDVTRKIDDYDALSDLVYFHEDLKSKNVVSEVVTQGYYFVNGETSAKEFYQRLLRKDSSLPKSAIKFQEAAEKLEEILNQY